VKKLVKAQEWYGLEPADAQVEGLIRKYSKSADNHVTFEEFSCLMLALAQL